MNIAYYVAVDVQATQFGLRPNQHSMQRCVGRPGNSILLVEPICCHDAILVVIHYPGAGYLFWFGLQQKMASVCLFQECLADTSPFSNMLFEQKSPVLLVAVVNGVEKQKKCQTNRRTSRLNLHRGRFSVKHWCAGGRPVESNGEEVEDGGGAAEDITGGPEVTEEGTHDPSPGNLGKGGQGTHGGKGEKGVITVRAVEASKRLEFKGYA